jgi:putative SOS response-associated peptidase YedK
MCRRFVEVEPGTPFSTRYRAKFRFKDRDEELEAAEKKRGGRRQSFNVATTHEIQYIVKEGSERYIDSHRWGFIHVRHKDVVNARSETIQLKPLFMKPFHDQRCIIPVQGWYESLTDAQGIKIPQYFWHAAEPVIAVAGVWDDFLNPKTNCRERRVCMVTCKPIKAAISVEHDRSPVLLNPEDIETWLDPDSPITALRSLMVPNNGMPIEVRRVTRRVNYQENGPDLLGPVDEAKDNQFVAMKEAEKAAKAEAKKAERKAKAEARKAERKAKADARNAEAAAKRAAAKAAKQEAAEQARKSALKKGVDPGQLSIFN